MLFKTALLKNVFISYLWFVGIQREDLYLIGNPNIKSKNSKVKILPFIPIDVLMTDIVNSKFSVIPLDDFNYSFAQLTLFQQMVLWIPIPARMFQQSKIMQMKVRV